MSAKILDGKIVRDKIGDNLKLKISNLKFKPKLVIIQVGDLPESNAYIRQKVLFGEKIGAIVKHQKFEDGISQEKLITHISSLNTDRQVNGIIVQMPIPKNLDKDKIIEAIDPGKDVDGQTSTNIKYLFENKKAGFIPATTKGILTLLSYYQIPAHGKNITVIGRSSLVGKPTALALINLDATVTVCHSSTKKLPDKTKNADILIVAVGRPKLIKNFHVSRGQTVIDVGINAVETEAKGQALATGSARPSPGLGPASLKTRPWQSSSQEKRPDLRPAAKLTGDVDFAEVSKIVAAITPVPGGIGPMTVASLFENLLAAHKN